MKKNKKHPLNKIKTYWSLVILSLLSLVYIVTFSLLSVRRHLAFASNFDLANMDHTMWNTLHGNFFSFRLGDEIVSRFMIHADLILVLLSPIYWVWNAPRALLVTQSIFLGLGAFPVYFIAMKVLKNKLLSLGIVVLYLLNPGLQWSNIYDFHGVTLAVPLLLATFYFLITKRWMLFVLFAFLSIITKEQISLVIAMMGLLLFFVFKERKIGTVTFLASIGWFIVMVFIIMPLFSPTGTHWGLNLFTNPVTPIQNVKDAASLPKFDFYNFITPDSIQYYKNLIEPFGFLPLLGFPWLIISSPDLFINVLSYHAAMKSIRFHYDSGVIPGIVIATIYGLSYIKIVIEKAQFLRRYSFFLLFGLVGIALLSAARFNYFYGPLPTTPSCWCFIYNVTEEDREFKRILNQIPPESRVTASLEIRPHVNHRREVYSIPSATQSADFIALITQNRIIGNYEPKEYENKLIPILLSNPQYEVVHKSEHFYLFKRR